DNVRHHPINSDRCQDQCQNAKTSERASRHPRREKRNLHVLSQRLHFVEWQGRVQTAHLSLHRGERGSGIAFRARDQADRRVVVAQLRPKERWFRFLSQAVIFPIAANSDDFPKWFVGSVEIETLADRLLPWEKSA